MSKVTLSQAAHSVRLQRHTWEGGHSMLDMRMLDTTSHRRSAAVLAILYVAIQTFQSFVFSQLPVPDGAVQELLQGPLPLNVARAASMLLSFFGLAYVFLVVCAAHYRHAPLLAIGAFLGFFVFCLLEVGLRSVELFHVQLQLPQLYAAATSDAARAQVLASLSGFQSIQLALYFPLMLAQALASLALCVWIRGGRGNLLLRVVMGINAARLFTRMWGLYLHVPWFDAINDALYLVLVYVIYGGIAAWLLSRRDG